jgi:hypothetical protein
MVYLEFPTTLVKPIDFWTTIIFQKNNIGFKPWRNITLSRESYMGSVDLLKGQKTMKFKWVYKIKLDSNGNMSNFIRQDW